MKAARVWRLCLIILLASSAPLSGPVLGQAELGASESGAAASAGRPPEIYICYFDDLGCSRCRHAEHQLSDYARERPNVHLEIFEWHEQDTFRIFRATMMRLEVPDKYIERLRPPVIVIGRQWITEANLPPSALNGYIAAQGPAASERVWDVDEVALAKADTAIRRYFSSYGPLAVVALGLVDGVNPCAIATLVFFMSYLAFLGRQGRDVLVAGLAFAAGIYVLYFGIGIGLAKLIMSIKNIDVLRTVVYAVMLILAGVFAVFSFLDFRRLREGRAEAVTLQLPAGLKRRIHAVIRERTRASLIGVGAFTAGLIVSCVELVCTGQVYLPAVAFVTDVPSLKQRVIMWLAIYNFAFILPLLVITGAVYFGVTSSSLAAVAQRNAAGTKLVMALFFAAIAIYFALQLS